MLTPTTRPPLTATKVVAWTRAPDRAFLLFEAHRNEPCGYAEVNAMCVNEEHMWIGHVLLDPRVRGRGMGTAFTRLLVDAAFNSLGAERLSLIVFPHNEAAIRSYLRAGFTLRGDEYHRFGRVGRRYRMLRFELDRAAGRRVAAVGHAQGSRGTRQLLPTAQDPS